MLNIPKPGKICVNEKIRKHSRRFNLVSINKEVFKNNSTMKYFKKLSSHNNMKATHNSTMLKRLQAFKDIITFHDHHTERPTHK
jgi:hypothetical protein